jgi:hypothetical protein
MTGSDGSYAVFYSVVLDSIVYTIRGEYPRLQPRDESDNSSTITMAGRDIPPFSNTTR